MAKEAWLNKNTGDLFKVILSLKSLTEAKAFFRDLLTEREIIEFGARWKAARMLDKAISYKEIEKETGLSSRTIARINIWLKKGKGGYRLLIHRAGK